MRRLMLLLALVCTLAAHGQQTDPDVLRAERMFGFVVNNQADSLYAYMSPQVKAMVQKEQLAGVMAQAEAQAGKYQGHGPWEVQEVMGIKAYVSMVRFERVELGALVIFDPDGLMLGIQLVPAEAVKKA